MEFSTTINHSSCDEVALFLSRNAEAFNPPFNQSVDIEAYAQKLTSHAIRFEVHDCGTLVALCSAYVNAESGVAYIPYICVDAKYKGAHLGQTLFEQLEQYCSLNKISRIDLEVRRNNAHAISFYDKLGFVQHSATEEKLQLTKIL
jgi:GNAT superfamily N-acetyltransferase